MAGHNAAAFHRDGGVAMVIKAALDAVRREVGMVFQQFNLFPHLSVLDNLTLAPVLVRKRPKPEVEQEALALLERVGIAEQPAPHGERPTLERHRTVHIASPLAEIGELGEIGRDRATREAGLLVHPDRAVGAIVQHQEHDPRALRRQLEETAWGAWLLL